MPAAVLVTGGAGFIGTALCHRLLLEGRRVVVVDRAAGRRQAQSLDGLVRRAAPGQLRVHRADLADVDLRTLVHDVEAVVHLAGRPGVQSSWAGGFPAHLHGNVGLAQQLLEAALDAPLTCVVLASSSSVYGHAEGPVAETARISPISPYGVSKAAMELLLGTYVARGVPAVALRYFTVYGRRQRPDMAVSLMLAAQRGGPAFSVRGDGTQQRDLTHVDDAVAATTAALDRPVEPGTLLNVGSGRPVAVNAMIDTVQRVTGCAVPVTSAPAAPGDPHRTHADPGRARRLLDWSATVDLADGIADQARAVGAALPRPVAAHSGLSPLSHTHDRILP